MLVGKLDCCNAGQAHVRGTSCPQLFTEASVQSQTFAEQGSMIGDNAALNDSRTDLKLRKHQLSPLLSVL